MIQIKRAYEPASKQDGYRVFIDRLWPRGLKKSEFVITAWMKELAPSGELRKEFGHDPAKWREFQAKYRQELKSPEAVQKLGELLEIARGGNLTIIYAARDPEHNNAVVLKALLDKKIQL